MIQGKALLVSDHGVMTVLGVITGVITLITPSHRHDHGPRSDHTRDHGRDLWSHRDHKIFLLGLFMVGVFKQVFGMGFFSWPVMSTVPFFFTVPSVMPQNEPILLQLSSLGYLILSGIWSTSLTLWWLPWLSELRGVKSNSNRRATKSNLSISSKILIALLRLAIPWPALSKKRQRELSKKV